MLFKISIKYYNTIIFSLFSFVKRYAVRNVKIRQYAVRRVKIRQYAVRKGGGGCHPHSRSICIPVLNFGRLFKKNHLISNRQLHS